MLKVVSWNVNSIKARLDRVLAFLERARPDVVCLQELKCVDEAFPADALRAAGYQAAVFGQKTYNGVAILARETPEEVTRGFRDWDDPASRFITARIRGVRIASAYVPNGQAVGSEKYAYKLEWLGQLRRLLDRVYRADEPLVLAGDFNVAPEDRDVHDPEAWRGQILFSEPERKALADVCAFGLRDLIRLHHPEGGIYSWWDYRQLAFPRNSGLRIDLLLATAPVAERCRAAYVDRDERKGKLPSDHAPVIAELDI